MRRPFEESIAAKVDAILTERFGHTVYEATDDEPEECHDECAACLAGEQITALLSARVWGETLREAAPDPRPIQGVIADAVAAALPETLQPVGAGLRFPGWFGASRGGQLTHYGKQIVDAVTPAVLAACQSATVEQQAYLVDAEIDEDTSDYWIGDTARVRIVGPWREPS